GVGGGSRGGGRLGGRPQAPGLADDRGSAMPPAVGFFTDTTVCIGCKACQVACHEWNDLPAQHGPGRRELPVLSGQSYDNTVSLSDVNWRHVKFIEQPRDGTERVPWLMMSD